MSNTLATMYNKHISAEAHAPVDIPSAMMEALGPEVDKMAHVEMPEKQLLFNETQDYIETTLLANVYPFFIQQQIANSSVRAMSTDRSKYQGLGDCFCITDPS